MSDGSPQSNDADEARNPARYLVGRRVRGVWVDYDVPTLAEAEADERDV